MYDLPIIFVLGLCLGSFVNALVWRIHQQTLNNSTKLSIINGRSMCPNCRHALGALDLIPLLSWIYLNGRCRYCRNRISAHYPIIELAMGIIFLVSFLEWPNRIAGPEVIIFSTWLMSCVGLVALAIYDYNWLILPSRIIYPTFIIALTGWLAHLAYIERDKIFISILNVIGSVFIASGVFWVIFEVTNGEWIGFGDVRLGLITSALLATPQKALLMIFLASLLGLIYSFFTLGKFKISKKIPYGPFLIGSTFIVVLWGDKIISAYSRVLI